MEETLSKFSVDNLGIELTDEKLFIKTLTSNETFALRAINGIGVVDLVDDYNEDLKEFKREKSKKMHIIVWGIIFILCGLFIFSQTSHPAGLIMGLFSLAIGGGFIFFSQSKPLEEPVLMSAVRLMMSGGNRDFTFDKSNDDSNQIAKFVANVENTLSAYHKNNR
ncbi:MAG: hypothetical protein WCL14_05445 [Bacteroidota bacterium]